MLETLSANTHKVITGICVIYEREQMVSKIVAASTTKVTFKKIPREKILSYIKSSEPYDKSGGYAIQGWVGKFVKKIEGSFHNVVGLPVDLLDDILNQEGLI